MKKEIKRYCEYSCTEIGQVLKDNWLIVPVGSVEQHSANLPLSVDMDISGAVAAQLCESEDMILAQPFLYGARSLPNSGGGKELPGTIFVKGDIFTAYAADILSQYIENGAEKIMVINGHYENYAFLCEAVELLSLDDDKKIVVINWWDVLKDSYMDKVTGGRFSGWPLEHAGIVETALEYYLKPELVKGIVYDEEPAEYLQIYSRGIGWMRASAGALSPNMGAVPAMGREIFKEIIFEIKRLVKTIERRM